MMIFIYDKHGDFRHKIQFLKGKFTRIHRFLKLFGKLMHKHLIWRKHSQCSNKVD